ncbi:MAG TPA: prolyl oligopeptidase family serine peptidase [Hyphomicrobiaceae bacterium]|nr:prolyl oligopeptidase family serine peptidase [Hyphomicrobiaceae bacterium]
MPKPSTPYGFWPSPITAALAAAGSRRFGSLTAEAGSLYWSESRPEENGRQTILCANAEGVVREVLPAPYSARSRVHEYGGGEFLVADDHIYFCNDSDQQVYVLKPGETPRRLSNAPDWRFADFVLDRRRQRLIGVGERHRRGSASPPDNRLVAIDLVRAPGTVSELARAHDFYAAPRLAADGDRLAFLAWDLPAMPWDAARLYVAKVAPNGRLGRPQLVAGGRGAAAFQPAWHPISGDLTFVLDDSGWGQLYAWDGRRCRRLHGRRDGELSRPQWVFGMRSYWVAGDGSIGAVSLIKGQPLFEIRHPKRGLTSYRKLSEAAARIDDPVAFADGFAALVSRPTASPEVMRLGRGGLKGVAAGATSELSRQDLSLGSVLEFRSSGRRTVYGLYYPPRNARHRGPSRRPPPTLVFVHGGPTSMTDAGLKLRTQYYTSRGFAVFDINYSGSTGFGRAYRQRLDGQWGIADVADCVAAATHLSRSGLADGERLAISGGSAGGYTTLMALARSDVFAAGSCHYGVSDLSLLLAHTHKFESGYLHRLMGTTAGRWQRVFAARSPLNHIDQIKAPVILFQGLDDKVVPPEQSRAIVAKLRQRGVEVAYHEFAGEAHGFRRAETIIAVLEAELDFLRRALALA